MTIPLCFFFLFFKFASVFRSSNFHIAVVEDDGARFSVLLVKDIGIGHGLRRSMLPGLDGNKEFLINFCALCCDLCYNLC